MASATFTLTPATRRPGSRALRDLAGGALLLAALLSLWTFFALGVAAPAGRLDATAVGSYAPVTRPAHLALTE